MLFCLIFSDFAWTIVRCFVYSTFLEALQCSERMVCCVLQQEDLQALGQLLLCVTLQSSEATQHEHFHRSMDTLTSSYSPDLQNIVRSAFSDVYSCKLCVLPTPFQLPPAVRRGWGRGHSAPQRSRGTAAAGCTALLLPGALAASARCSGG